jgi:hypothetical protein
MQTGLVANELCKVHKEISRENYAGGGGGVNTTKFYPTFFSKKDIYLIGHVFTGCF